MFRVVIMYPKTNDSHFDMNYYLTHHIPMIRDIWRHTSLGKIEIDQGIANAAPGQPVLYESISYFYFEKIEDFQNGFMQRGGEIMGDIHNYTDVLPQIQIDQVVIAQ